MIYNYIQAKQDDEQNHSNQQTLDRDKKKVGH